MVYAVAIVATALAILLRWALLPLMGPASPYITLYLAIVVAAAAGGAGPGLAATFLGALVANVLLVPPLGRIHIDAGPVEHVRFGVYILSGIGISLIAGAMHRSRRRAEEREEWFRAAFENAPVGIEYLDLKGRYHGGNARLCEMLGYSSAELQQRTFVDITHPEDIAREQLLLRELLSGEISTYSTEKRYIHKDGYPVWVRITSSLARVPKPYRIAIIEDISARKEAQEARAHSEQTLSLALAAAGLGTWDWNVLSGELKWSDRCLGLFGLPPGTAMSYQKFLERVHPDDREWIDHSVHNALVCHEDHDIELRAVHPDGSIHWVASRGRASHDKSGRPVRMRGVAMDITKRKETELALRQREAALRESQERFRQLVESLPQLFWTCEPDGSCDYLNPQWVQYTGMPEATQLGYGWLEQLHPDDRSRVMEAWHAATASGGCYDTEYRIRRHDGVYHWFKTRATPMHDENGRVVKWFGSSTDIEDLRRTQADLRAARDAAEAAQAAAERASRAKDHFMAVLSHELRTPLTPVLATVSMLQETLQADEPTRESLEVIHRNVELEARLIDDLLDVTRISRGKIELDKQTVDLCTVIRRAIEVCTPDIEARRVHFELDLGSAAPYRVEADAARLQQVFWNLLKNSIKFTPPGGCIGIRCWREDDSVVAEVKDSGAGIDREHLARIFNAFEQAERSITRRFGGLGLGLAISKALVEMHGGSIEAQSDGKGKGATFTLRLPLAKGQPVGQQPAMAPASSQAGNGHRRLKILLVEDHGDTARIMGRLLRSEGHEVEMAADVATGLDLATRQHFDLLLSDLGLPDGSGLDLMRELRALGKAPPAIALSGYGQDQDIDQSRGAGFAAHLTKPVSFQQLHMAIDMVLNGQHSTAEPA